MILKFIQYSPLKNLIYCFKYRNFKFGTLSISTANKKIAEEENRTVEKSEAEDKSIPVTPPSGVNRRTSVLFKKSAKKTQQQTPAKAVQENASTSSTEPQRKSAKGKRVGRPPKAKTRLGPHLGLKDLSEPNSPVATRKRSASTTIGSDGEALSNAKRSLSLSDPPLASEADSLFSAQNRESFTQYRSIKLPNSGLFITYFQV